MYNRNIKQPGTVFSPVDKVIGILVLSDVLISGGYGLIAPILAIFISNHIIGATLETIGIFTAIYLLTKCLFQLLTTELIQKIKGERDEFYFDFIGAFASAMVYLIFPLITNISELYVAGFILGISSALTYPSWSSLFNNHVKNNKIWGMYYTILDAILALAAIIGVLIAASLGFDYLFLIMGSLGVIGSFLLIVIKKDIFSQKIPGEKSVKSVVVEERIMSVAKAAPAKKVSTKKASSVKKATPAKKAPVKKTSTAKKATSKKTTTKKSSSKRK